MKTQSGLYKGASFAFIFNNCDEILILRENNGKYSWDMPGGTLECDESPVSGLHREVLEETGLTVKVLHLFCFLKWDRHESGHPILVAFYLTQVLSGEVKLSAEHNTYRWVDLKTLRKENIELPPGWGCVENVFKMYDQITNPGLTS